MNRKEAMRQTHQQNVLMSLGFTANEAESLRRISMTLRRWYELECGNSNDYGSWAIERDEATDKPYMVRYPHASNKVFRTAIADRETGAKKRLNKIIAERNERSARLCNLNVPEPVSAYIQTDPRGGALYIIRPGDVPEGSTIDSCYSRGICVY